MAKFCPECGKPLNNPNAKFCANCGTRLEVAEPVTPAAPVAPAAPVKPKIQPRKARPSVEIKTKSKPKNSVDEYQAKEIGKVVKRFSTATEAYEFSSKVVMQWLMYFDELADQNEFKAFCTTLDAEYQMPADDDASYYVVDIHGAVGVTEDAEKHIKWLGKVYIQAPQVRTRTLADSPRTVVMDEVKAKIKRFKENFTIKGIRRKLLWSGGVMLLMWIVSAFFPALLGGRGSMLKKIIDFLTFAQGGVSNSIYFQIGGFFGKTLVMTTLFAVLLGGFKLVKKGLPTVLDNAKSFFKSKDKLFRAMFLFGLGTALFLYNFFTGTAAVITYSMAGIAGAISMLWAVGGGIHFIRKMVVALTADKEGAGKERYVNMEKTIQVLSGMSVGFALSVLLTFTGILHLHYSLGLIVLIWGYVVYRKAAVPKLATVVSLVALLSLPVTGVWNAFAQNDAQELSIGEQVEQERKESSLKYYDAKTMSADEQKDFLTKIGAPLKERDGRNDAKQYAGKEIWYFEGKDGNIYNLNYGPDGSFQWAQLVEYGSDYDYALSDYDDDSNASDAAKAAAEALGLLSILIALLEANENGEIIGGPTDVTGGYPESYPPFGSLGGDKWISRDENGVITKRNPITGEETWWVPNEDGSFTKYGSDEQKTFDDLREDSDFADRNRELFAENQRKEQEWVDDQRKKLQQDIEAQNRYWEAEMKRRAELKAQQEEHQKYIDNLADKYGTFAELLHDRLERAQTLDEKNAKREAFWGDVFETGEKAAYVTKTAADWGVDALAVVTGPMGQQIQMGYKGLSELAGTTAEALCHEKSLSSLGKGLTIGTIKGGIFMLQTKVGGGKSESLKYVTNVFGEATRAGLSAVNENKSAKEIYEDTLKGGVNGLIFSVSDHAVGKVSGFVGSHTGSDTCSKEEVEAVGTVISYMIKESATIR